VENFLIGNFTRFYPELEGYGLKRLGIASGRKANSGNFIGQIIGGHGGFRKPLN